MFSIKSLRESHTAEIKFEPFKLLQQCIWFKFICHTEVNLWPCLLQITLICNWFVLLPGLCSAFFPCFVLFCNKSILVKARDRWWFPLNLHQLKRFDVWQHFQLARYIKMLPNYVDKTCNQGGIAFLLKCVLAINVISRRKDCNPTCNACFCSAETTPTTPSLQVKVC